MTYAEYFDLVTYKATYHLGDRIIGKHNGIPFVGTVGNDRQLNPTEGPRISVHLDLPLKVDGTVKCVILVKHKDVKRLKELSV
jgi:hypothetical protein